MSNGFNNVGRWTLGSGASIRVGILKNNGQDFGAQAIMADPIGPGALTVSDLTKVKAVKVPNALETSYLVTVTNVGEDTIFSLSGGGY